MKLAPTWSFLASVALAVQMSGRVLTPNGDGIHDSVAFTLGAAPSASPHAQVFDVCGRRVAELQPVSSTQWRWDGKDYAGRAVASGVSSCRSAKTLPSGTAFWPSPNKRLADRIFLTSCFDAG